MTEETGRASFSPQPGQAESAPSPQPADGGKGNEPITEARLLQLLDERDQRIGREIQSRTDKSEDRISKKIRQELESLNRTVEVQREAGIEITDQQLAAARQRIYDRAYTQQPEPEQVAATQPATLPQRQAAQPAPGSTGSEDPTAVFVNQQMDAIMAEYGVEISQEEAQAAGLTTITNPRQFLKKFEETVANKAKQASTPAQARIPAGGASAATNLQAAYDAERTKIPRGSTAAKALQELRIKYRKLGLNV